MHRIPLNSVVHCVGQSPSLLPWKPCRKGLLLISVIKVISVLPRQYSRLDPHQIRYNLSQSTYWLSIPHHLDEKTCSIINNIRHKKQLFIYLKWHSNATIKPLTKKSLCGRLETPSGKAEELSACQCMIDNREHFWRNTYFNYLRLPHSHHWSLTATTLQFRRNKRIWKSLA